MSTISEIDLHIASRLTMARKSRGLSQEALAQELGATQKQVQAYEQGKKPLTPGLLYDAALVLQVNASYFYEGLDGVTPCPFSLSGDRYALLRNTMQCIAGHDDTLTGYRKNLSRHEMIYKARRICEILGWNYRLIRDEDGTP